MTLSPFVVDASKDIGYYAENTLAGSRLNSNVSDLASSITVVTKQQLVDTASVDVHDVFMYEANTEGLNTYTRTEGSGVVNRGTVHDVGAGHGFANDPGTVWTAANATRVRGLDSVDNTVDYYPTVQRLPFDTYNTNSVEINRGPNSMLFGFGSPAGIVNQSRATAVVDKNGGQVEMRIGSWGSERASISGNKTLIDGKLAVYGAALYDKRGFQRKPSGEWTDRYYAAITFKPFKKTTINANYEYYDSFSRRANYLTPQDYVTPWIKDGRPVWNPVTRTVTYLDTGARKGPYVLSSVSDGFDPAIHAPGGATTSGSVAGTYNSNTHVINSAANMMTAGFLMTPNGGGYGSTNPLFVRSLEWSRGLSPLAITPDSAQYLPWNVNVGTVAQGGLPNSTADITARTAAQWRILERGRNTRSTAWATQPFLPDGRPLIPSNYIFSGVNDKSIYDWEKINTASPNSGSLSVKTMNIEFSQEILPNLNVQLGWFSQRADAMNNYNVGQQTGARLWVDTNLYLADGTANPYFGIPYLEDFEVDTYTNPEENDNYRAGIAYELDLTKKDGWTKWLGRHRLMGIFTRQDRTQYQTRSRQAVTGGDARYFPPSAGGAWSYAQNGGNASRLRQYYFGHPASINVTSTDTPTNPDAPVTVSGPIGQITQNVGYWANAGIYGGGGQTDFNIPTYNWITGAWEQANVNMSTELWWAGTAGNRRVLDSMTFGIQSYFWDDRIIFTGGIRRDKSTSNASLYNITSSDWFVDGIAYDRQLYKKFWGPKQEIEADTRSYGIVAKVLRWDGGELSLTYNDATNFPAPPTISHDFYGNALPDPAGSGKDYGIGLSMFQNKLVARLNWFENESTDSRVGNTLMDRTFFLEQTYVRNWAEAVVRYLDGEDTTSNFMNATVRPRTAAQEARIEELLNLGWGGPEMTINWPADQGLNVRGTQDVSAEGMEFQLIYNPLPNWNIKLTGSKQETVYTGINQEWAAWVMPGATGGRESYWRSVEVPQAWIDAAPADRRDLTNVTLNYGTSGAGRAADLSNFWNGYGFGNTLPGYLWSDNGAGFRNPQDYYEANILTQRAEAEALSGLPTPNQRPYRANILTNYAFQEGRLRGLAVGGAMRWEDKAIAGYYGMEVDDPARAGQLIVSDLDRPIYVSAETYFDFWASYTTRVFDNKYGMRVQLNIRDVFESGGLRPVGYNYDGTVTAYRIVDPRQVYLTATFTF